MKDTYKIACFDVETLGLTSESVVLSMAITFAELNSELSIKKLMDNTFFVKLSVKDQIQKYKRTIDVETAEWWKKQCKTVKELSLIPKDTDISTEEGIAKLRAYVKSQCNPETTMVFARGSIDQLLLDSLTKQVGGTPIFGYSQWRDCRTYIECMAKESLRGYTEVSLEKFPDYDRNAIIKHDPRYDTVLDIAMILSC